MSSAGYPLSNWTLTPGYHRSQLNPSDNRLLNEINLWSAIQRSGGINRVCCPGLDWEEPWLNMPGNGTRVSWINQAPVSSFSANVDFSILQRKVPLGFDGSIAAIVCGINDPAYVDGSTQITWRLKINEYWVPNCGSIVNQLGSLQSPFEVGFVRMYSDQVLQFFANVSTAGKTALAATSLIRVALIGWVYPRG